MIFTSFVAANSNEFHPHIQIAMIVCVVCVCFLLILLSFCCILNHFSFLNKRTFILTALTHMAKVHGWSISQFLRGLHLFSKRQRQNNNNNKFYTNITFSLNNLRRIHCVMANEIGFFHETYATVRLLFLFCFFFPVAVVSLSPNIIIIEPHNCITGVWFFAYDIHTHMKMMLRFYARGVHVNAKMSYYTELKWCLLSFSFSPIRALVCAHFFYRYLYLGTFVAFPLSAIMVKLSPGICTIFHNIFANIFIMHCLTFLFTILLLVIKLVFVGIVATGDVEWIIVCEFTRSERFKRWTQLSGWLAGWLAAWCALSPYCVDH